MSSLYLGQSTSGVEGLLKQTRLLETSKESPMKWEALTVVADVTTTTPDTTTINSWKW